MRTGQRRSLRTVPPLILNAALVLTACGGGESSGRDAVTAPSQRALRLSGNGVARDTEDIF